MLDIVLYGLIFAGVLDICQFDLLVINGANNLFGITLDRYGYYLSILICYYLYNLLKLHLAVTAVKESKNNVI